MKNKALKFIALILVFSLVFAFSACKADKKGTTTLFAGQTTADIMSRPLSVEVINLALTGSSTWDGNYSSLTDEQKQAITDYFVLQEKPVEFREDGVYFVRSGETAAPTEESTALDDTTTVAGDTTATPGTTTAKHGTTTSTPGTTITTPGTSTRPSSTTNSSGSTSATTPATTATTEPKPDPLVTIEAPLDGTAAEVIGFYNEYGNRMKTYKGKVTVTKKDGTIFKINSITASTPSLEQMVKDKLQDDYREKTTYTFVKGTSTTGSQSLSKWLPRSGSTNLSELVPTGENGVQSATCTASGTGYKVVIVMNDDKTKTPTEKPIYVSKCMDAPSPSAGSLTSATLVGSITYTGCAIEAIFDEYGRTLADLH